MRIIAGEFRGRPLLPPENTATRPITDRAKQSLFDILTPEIGDQTVVYDCFAGTGSMGLECLSRGANRATFFEAGRSALDRLGRNIKTLGVTDRARVVGGDLFKWFDATPAPAPVERVNLFFLDPPYRYLVEQADRLRRLATQLAAHLAPGAIVIFRHDAADTLELSPLERYDERRYGNMAISFLRAANVNM